MKKLISIVLVFLLILAGTWIYFANKFEKMVSEELIPAIQAPESMITADLDSIVINKFKFQVELKDVTLFPASNVFVMNTDSMLMSYKPFYDKIKLSFNGKKLSMGSGDTEVYIPSPDHTITFNRSILDFDNVSIDTVSKNLFIYSSKNDNLIASAVTSESSVSSKLKDGVYSIDLTANGNQLKINPDSNYSKNVLKVLMPKSNLVDINSSDYLHYYYKLIEKTGPSDFSGKYSMKLKEEYLKNITSALQAEAPEKALELLIELTKENYALHAKETLTNSALDHSWSLDTSSDSNKINTKFNVSCLNKYTETQRQDTISITQDLLLNRLSALNFKVEERDLTPLATEIADIKKLKLEFNFTHDVKSNEASNALKIELNDFSANLNGGTEDSMHNLHAVIKTPTMLINGLTALDDSIKPILAKNTNKEFATNIESFVQIMENVKDNGFNALAAFHKNSNLEANEELQADIIINLQNFEFKINDKGILDILTDENIIKFLQGMPKDQKKK